MPSVADLEWTWQLEWVRRPRIRYARVAIDLRLQRPIPFPQQQGCFHGAGVQAVDRPLLVDSPRTISVKVFLFDTSCSQASPLRPNACAGSSMVAELVALNQSWEDQDRPALEVGLAMQIATLAWI